MNYRAKKRWGLEILEETIRVGLVQNPTSCERCIETTPSSNDSLNQSKSEENK